jgi:hypothetical protein
VRWYSYGFIVILEHPDDREAIRPHLQQVGKFGVDYSWEWYAYDEAHKRFELEIHFRYKKDAMMFKLACPFVRRDFQGNMRFPL